MTRLTMLSLTTALAVTAIPAVAQELTTVNMINPLPRSTNFFPVVLADDKEFNALSFALPKSAPMNFPPDLQTNQPVVTLLNKDSSGFHMGRFHFQEPTDRSPRTSFWYLAEACLHSM